MRIRTVSADDVRHRLLEGVLLRLAPVAEDAGYVLRGGMLLRQWFRPLNRVAGDLDLVTPLPFDAHEAGARLLDVLRTATVEDGVSFDFRRGRVDAIALETGNPGARVFLTGTSQMVELDFHVDITGSAPMVPAPEVGDMVCAAGTARMRLCRPESVAGQKMQALRHLGETGWRAKDLDDLRLLLSLVPLDAGGVRESVASLFAAIGATAGEARELFAESSWWGTKFASARWGDFAKSPRGRHAPGSLGEVVAEIRGRLGSLMGEIS